MLIIQTIFDFLNENIEDFRIKKPIRLIELFAGYGSQAMALKMLNVPFEHHFVCEVDPYAIKTYNAFHQTNFEISDITKIHGDDLKIQERDRFDYILTYSFPCTDLSSMGKRKGMAKGSNTRSSLLWEVERILKELGDDLPQILVMENVPQVLKESGWNEWYCFLEKLGYSNYCEVLNSKDYFIPQNRERVFMVSILGDYNYTFPPTMELKYHMKDFLEQSVDEKYYISDKLLKCLTDTNDRNGFIRGKLFRPHDLNTADIAWTITTAPRGRATDNFIIEDGSKEQLILFGTLYGGKWDKKYESNRRVYDSKGLSPTITAGGGGGVEPKIHHNKKIRTLTPKECFRLMGIHDTYIGKLNVSNTQAYKQAGNSIVVTVLMAVFGKMLDLDYEEKIKDMTKNIIKQHPKTKADKIFKPLGASNHSLEEREKRRFLSNRSRCH